MCFIYLVFDLMESFIQKLDLGKSYLYKRIQIKKMGVTLEVTEKKAF